MHSKIIKFFDEDKIHKIARETLFVQRASQINGFNFFCSLTLGKLNVPASTLSQLANFFLLSSDIDVSSQAIDCRFNKYAVNFMKKIFELAVAMAKRPLGINTKALLDLDHIFLIDSTTFELHDSLAGTFKGFGGTCSNSSMRIQLVYDYIEGTIYVEIGDIRLTDAKTLKEIIEMSKLNMKGKCLFLQDLGYAKMETFNLMDLKSIYFISRLTFRLGVKDIKSNPIDFNVFLKMAPDEFNLTVIIGDLTCRLIGKKLPEEIVKKRIDDAIESSRNSKISEEYKLFLTYSLLITNLPKKYTPEIIFTLYRIRWRIELIFKTWKSIIKINAIRTTKTERLMCEVYGSLILSALSNMMCEFVEDNLEEELVSLHRAMQQMKVCSLAWCLAIKEGAKVHFQFIKNLAKNIRRHCIKKSQKKPTIEQRIKNAFRHQKNIIKRI